MFGFGVILPTLMMSLNENRGKTAFIGSLRLGTTFFATVFASKVCEEYTCRVAGGIGLILQIIGFLLSSVCRSVYLLYFTYSLLTGLGSALSFTSGFIAIRKYFNTRYSLAVGIVLAGAGLGTLIIGPVMQAMLDYFGWENTFRIFAGICILELFNILVMDPNVEDVCDQNEGRANISNKKGNNGRKLVFAFLDLSVWSFPEYTICVIAIFVSNFGQYSALIHMVKFSEELSMSNGSTLLVFFGTATVISRVICGRLCDISFINPRYVHQVGAIMSGLSTILLGFAQIYIHLVVFAVFYGIADGAFRVTLQILLMNTVPDATRKPSAFGQANMVTSVSLSAGPAIAGLMADKMGSYRGAFYMAGTFTILGGSVLFVHLCFCGRQDPNEPQVDISELNVSNEDYDRAVNLGNHPLSCNGPAVQFDEESQTTAL